MFEWQIEISKSHSSIKLIFYKRVPEDNPFNLQARGSIEIDEGEIDKWKRAIDFLNKLS